MAFDVRATDCLQGMKDLPENSVDTIITDPPYGLSFMGKEWDHGVPGKEFWIEALRVAKPGAFLLAFGGTRTFHRLAVSIEDAGWEMRDTMSWLYGQGFPKSYDLHKATKEPSWAGWGTALKPAWEPIIVAMKPLDGTFAQNALQHGVAGLNIDGARIGHTERPIMIRTTTIVQPTSMAGKSTGATSSGETTTLGRWPANVILDEYAATLLDEQTGELSSGANPTCRGGPKFRNTFGEFEGQETCEAARGADKGGGSRFFYCAKASRAEREVGLDDFPTVRRTDGRENDIENPRLRTSSVKNHHPTVKPLALMRYLCKLTKTPTGGFVLDPFLGSGTTGVAAVLEGRHGLGFELDPSYADIARARIASVTTVDRQEVLRAD